MTATQTITVPTESSPSPAGRPAPPRRRRLLAAGLVVLVAAVVALTVWLLPTSSPSQPGPITPVSAAAPQQQAAPAPDQANAGSGGYAPNVDNSGGYASNVDNSGGYSQFCQNSPVLCSAPATQAPPAAAGFLEFCQNSPALCTKPN
jgi:hypothetical protein